MFNMNLKEMFGSQKSDSVDEDENARNTLKNMSRSIYQDSFIEPIEENT